MAKNALLLTLATIGVAFLFVWIAGARKRQTSAAGQGSALPTAPGAGVGFLTNFFDTLGIGSFATTTTLFRSLKMIDDRLIPGTLNVGHALPTVAQALIYIQIVEVDVTTLALLILASVLGAIFGAPIVCGWSRRGVQIGMGVALLVAASLMVASMRKWLPGGGVALHLSGGLLVAGLVGNFVLGALMTLGIGLYAPCMIMVSLLGMSPAAAFPIMMGSCAFLMPVGSVQFIRKAGYDLRAAIGLAVGGVPGVLIAAYIVKQLSLDTVRLLVIVVVVYTAVMLLRAALSAGSSGVPPSDVRPVVTE
jgi:uncharacterized membrane protein YfcA